MIKKIEIEFERNKGKEREPQRPRHDLERLERSRAPWHNHGASFFS